MKKRRIHTGAALKRLPLSLALTVSILLVTGCGLLYELLLPAETFPPFGELPDAVLEVPVTEGTPATSFGATAKDINSSGRVVGFTNSANPKANPATSHPRTDSLFTARSRMQSSASVVKVISVVRSSTISKNIIGE